MRALVWLSLVGLVACSDSNDSTTASTTPGAAGAAGAGGTGQAGSAGQAGFAGQAGSAGTSGGAAGSGGASSGGNPAGSSFVSQVGAEYCKQESACCAAAGKPIDLAACQAYFDQAATSVTAAATFDPALAATCLTAIPALACDAVPPTSCGAALVGPGKPGDTCNWDFDCQFPTGAADAGCVQTGSGTFCYVELPAKEGAACGGPKQPVGNQCSGVPGYFCDYPSGSSTGACKKQAAIGGSCSIAGGKGCEDGAYCNGSTCVKSGTTNEACDALWACAKGLYCTSYVPPFGTCQPQLAEGATCTGNDQCLGDCSPAGTCTAPTTVGPSAFCL